MIFYRYIKLPIKVRGCTVVDTEGNYNVYINESLSEEEQQLTLQHEIEHIKKDHLYNDRWSIENIELKTERAVRRLL